MTTKELAKIVERNIRNNPTPMIDTETGLAALENMSKVADQEGVRWALVGGIGGAVGVAVRRNA